MSQYKLIYFEDRCRAEPIRLCFIYAGIPFDDIKLTDEEFYKLKDTFPNGQVPVLKFDGTILSQSGAILRFVARKFGLCGRDELEAAKADELFNVHYDRLQEQFPYYLHKVEYPGYEDGEKIFKESFHPSAIKALDYYLSVINDPNKSCYVLASGPSYADFVIAEHVETIFEWEPELKEKYQKLVEYKEKIYNLAPIADYIKNRKHVRC